MGATMKIILIGFMGSGKTTVASILAKKLNLEVIEMDDLIIKKFGKSINQIFNQDGEERFREMEIEVSKSLISKDECIISSGGGIVMNKINIDFLRKNGKIVFLKTSFSEIEKRLKDINDRPLFRDKKIVRKLFTFRKRLYEEYADLIINTDKKSVEKIAYEIISQN